LDCECVLDGGFAVMAQQVYHFVELFQCDCCSLALFGWPDLGKRCAVC
jgi:hypothetical protein